MAGKVLTIEEFAAAIAAAPGASDGRRKFNVVSRHGAEYTVDLTVRGWLLAASRESRDRYFELTARSAEADERTSIYAMRDGRPFSQAFAEFFAATFGDATVLVERQIPNRVKCGVCQEVVESRHARETNRCRCGNVVVSDGLSLGVHVADPAVTATRLDWEGEEIPPAYFETNIPG